MTDFDARDLLSWAESARFETIGLHYEVTINQRAFLSGISWDAFLGFSPNPLCPTVEEAEHPVGDGLSHCDQERRQRYSESGHR
jgi:hypothetical protein